MTEMQGYAVAQSSSLPSVPHKKKKHWSNLGTKNTILDYDYRLAKGSLGAVRLAAALVLCQSSLGASVASPPTSLQDGTTFPCDRVVDDWASPTHTYVCASRLVRVEAAAWCAGRSADHWVWAGEAVVPREATRQHLCFRHCLIVHVGTVIVLCRSHPMFQFFHTG